MSQEDKLAASVILEAINQKNKAIISTLIQDSKMMLSKQKTKAQRDKMLYENCAGYLLREQQTSSTLRENQVKLQTTIKNQISTIKVDMQKQSETIEEKESIIIQQNEELENIRIQLAEAHETIRRTQSEIQTERTDQTNTVIQLRNQLKEKERIIEEQSVTIHKVTDDLREEREHRANVEHQVEEAQQQIHQLHETCTAQRKEVEQKKEEMRRKDTEIRQYQAEIQKEVTQMQAEKAQSENTATDSKQAQLAAELELLEAKACFVRLHAQMRKWVSFFLAFHESSEAAMSETAGAAILREEWRLAQMSKQMPGRTNRDWEQLLFDKEMEKVLACLRDARRMKEESVMADLIGQDGATLEEKMISLFENGSEIPSMQDGMDAVREFGIAEWSEQVKQAMMGEYSSALDTSTIESEISQVNSQYSQLLEKLTEADDPLQTVIPSIQNTADYSLYKSAVIINTPSDGIGFFPSVRSHQAPPVSASTLNNASLALSSMKWAAQPKSSVGNERLRKIAQQLSSLFTVFVRDAYKSRDETQQQLLRIVGLVKSLMEMKEQITTPAAFASDDIQLSVKTDAGDRAERITREEVPLLYQQWEKIKTSICDSILLFLHESVAEIEKESVVLARQINQEDKRMERLEHFHSAMDSTQRAMSGIGQTAISPSFNRKPKEEEEKQERLKRVQRESNKIANIDRLIISLQGYSQTVKTDSIAWNDEMETVYNRFVPIRTIYSSYLDPSPLMHSTSSFTLPTSYTLNSPSLQKLASSRYASTTVIRSPPKSQPTPVHASPSFRRSNTISLQSPLSPDGSGSPLAGKDSPIRFVMSPGVDRTTVFSQSSPHITPPMPRHQRQSVGLSPSLQSSTSIGLNPPGSPSHTTSTVTFIHPSSSAATLTRVDSSRVSRTGYTAGMQSPASQYLRRTNTGSGMTLSQNESLFSPNTSTFQSPFSPAAMRRGPQ
ncbi:hypothetical protein BLNAU_2898 [Blattamonas nauphoetae]|uniref:Uncharacterized protein n=1 Tax=Blattamonas nauphoetae TaxID=2049346 RepID=A0ABQ9YEN2_9EUKA|nr:hypothetical protein BLNAU_2898 [Blattamonas nauphoetae]